MLTNEFINESNIAYIIKQYISRYKVRITSFNIYLDLSISTQCLERFKRQFIQIKCVHNILLC